jgi:2-polyprenyl-3-methyl-5-hydroxy-6-metoxy-1,4-benzoquinol methylase
MGMDHSRLEQRVNREKISHDEDGILENAIKLKGVFVHVLNSPTMMRCEHEQSQFFKDVAGKKVLDIGCGFGEKSLYLAKMGAQVNGIDISNKYVESAKDSAEKIALSGRCDFEVMDAHHLEFPDNHFDLVVGRGIIHHLDLQVCLLEMRRVLKPGGRAIFLEPLADNPLLKFFRVLTPRARTVDEKPLTATDLAWVEREWAVESSYFGLISAPIAMLTSIFLRPFPNNPLLTFADIIERRLNKLRPLQKYNQYVLLNLIKK